MARMSAQEAAEVAQALARQSSQKTDNGLPPASGPGGIPGGIFRGKQQDGTATATQETTASLATNYAETARTYFDNTTTDVITSDGLFKLSFKQIQTLTIAEATATGSAIKGTEVKLTFARQWD